MNEFMKKGLMVLLSLVCITIACNKDKLSSTPSLKFKSSNGNHIPINVDYVVDFEFADKEGDIDDTLYVIRERLNQKGPVVMPTFNFRVPNFPHQSRGELKVTMDYNRVLIVGLLPIGSSPNFEPDTMQYHFALKDKANHISDTVLVGPVIVARQ